MNVNDLYLTIKCVTVSWTEIIFFFILSFILRSWVLVYSFHYQSQFILNTLEKCSARFSFRSTQSDSHQYGCIVIFVCNWYIEYHHRRHPLKLDIKTISIIPQAIFVMKSLSYTSRYILECKILSVEFEVAQFNRFRRGMIKLKFFNIVKHLEQH